MYDKKISRRIGLALALVLIVLSPLAAMGGGEATAATDVSFD